MSTETQDQVIYLDPSQINTTGSNIRFHLHKFRLEKLKQQIAEAGQVLTPIEVEPEVDGQYPLTTGNYRVAAVTALNKEGAGLQIPAIVRPLADAKERLKRQLSENLDRENMSAIDSAIAIKQMFDQGFTRSEVRASFARPTGRKGITLQPASNAWVNMMVSFLDLPKAIQEKIHDGRLGVKAAYLLTRVPPEKRAAILEDAEADRLKSIEADEKEEEKFLEQERKAEEAQTKQAEAVKELEAAKEAAQAADKAAESAAQAAAEAYKKVKLDKGSKSDEEKAAKAQALKDAEAKAKEAEKAAEKARKDLEKLTIKVKSAAEHAAERAKKLKEAREAAAKSKGATPASVTKAAQAKGVDTAGRVKLSATQMRAAIDEMALPGPYPKVRAIAQEIIKCFDSILTPGQLFKAVAQITGESKEKEKKAS